MTWPSPPARSPTSSRPPAPTTTTARITGSTARPRPACTGPLRSSSGAERLQSAPQCGEGIGGEGPTNVPEQIGPHLTGGFRGKWCRALSHGCQRIAGARGLGSRGGCTRDHYLVEQLRRGPGVDHLDHRPRVERLLDDYDIGVPDGTTAVERLDRDSGDD